MHFEVLVEDQSGKIALEGLLPKIIGKDHSFKITAYKGVGRFRKNMRDTRNAAKRILLDNLPKLLKGYGRTFAEYPDDYSAAVILVCDLDDKCLAAFRQELIAILNACNPQPETRFCIAIEEGEAWLLGDMDALKAAYPNAKDNILGKYVQDDICGTWELLADAVCPGGAKLLKEAGWQAVGAEKSNWAKHITPHMDVKKNLSPSFSYFRQKLLELMRT
jgi:hypothetical protein